MMVSQMMTELKKFLVTFGLILILFLIIARQLNSELKVDSSNMWSIICDIFDGLNGKQDFKRFTNEGMLFNVIFVYLFNILFINVLVAMFINRYKYVYVNLDAFRRMNVIRLKNSSCYDRFYGGVTITFFPFSVLVLPFIPAIVAFKSERLSDFLLKVQYFIMVVMYCFLAIILSLPIIPLLYIKSVLNALYICMYNKR